MDSDMMVSAAVNKAVNDNLIRYQIDSSDILETIEHNLKGEVWTIKDERGLWERKYTPKVNKEGINKVMGVLNTYLNKVFCLSNFKEREIYRIARNVKLKLIDVLELKWREYDIDKENFAAIINEITDMVFANLMRARNGEYMKLLVTSIDRKEIKTENEASQKQSLFN